MSWAKLALVLAQLISMVWRTLVSAKDRELGRTESTRDALEVQAQDNQKAVESFARSEREHVEHDDDNAFDQSFKREV